jgi:hypothetical protein
MLSSGLFKMPERNICHASLKILNNNNNIPLKVSLHFKTLFMSVVELNYDHVPIKL